MEKKKTNSGLEFHLASSVQDFVDHSSSLEQDATVILTNVSLRIFSREEYADHLCGAGRWYKVFDHMTETDMYWPSLHWHSEESGLTPEMRECGYFIAPVLEIQWSTNVGARIVRILQREQPKGVAKGFVAWAHRICSVFGT